MEYVETIATLGGDRSTRLTELFSEPSIEIAMELECYVAKLADP
jgi:hypothetical protein